MNGLYARTPGLPAPGFALLYHSAVPRLAPPVALAVILLAGAWLGFSLAAGDTSTEDEHVHLYSGMLLVQQGRTSINLEHPPLAKIIAAATLVPLGSSRAIPVELWEGDASAIASFAYRNRIPLPKLLAASRAPFVVMTLALGLVIYLFALRFIGTWAAVAAAALTIFSPIVLAVGHLVHTDLAVTLFVTTAWLTGSAVLLGGHRDLPLSLISGAAWGCALLTKFSAVIFAAAFVVVLLVVAFREPARRRRLLASAAIASAVALATVAAGMFLAFRSADPAWAAPLAAHMTPATRALLLFRPTTPLGLWSAGFEIFLMRGGLTINYLAGNFSRDGWWYYFPVAFALKTPLAVIALIALRKITFFRSRDRLDLILIAPAAFYLVVSLASPYNIGVRHLLPVFPFLHLWLSRLVERVELPGTRPRDLRSIRYAAVALVAAAVAAPLVSHPHYMGWFNSLAGGRRTATFLLADSNVDWGQSNGRLKSLLEEKGLLPARVLLMGGSLPEAEIAPGVAAIDPSGPPTPGTYAVSRSLFVELQALGRLGSDDPVRRHLARQPRFSPDMVRWAAQLTERGELVAVVGNSIDVYRVE
jgi:hypothetical protein